MSAESPAASPRHNSNDQAEERQTLFPAGVERLAVWLLLVYAISYTLLLGTVWTHHPGLDHGDWYSDANVLNAGRNYDQWRLRLNHGLPTHQGTWTPEHPIKPYTHYPPGPEWVHQASKKLGLRELWQQRAVAVGFAGSAILLFAVVARQLAGSWMLGLLAAFFYSFSLPFSGYADSLHEHAYMQVTLFGFLAGWLAFESGGRGRWLWLMLSAACFFADAWLTFEHVLLIGVFVGARALWRERRRNFGGAVVLALTLFAALGIRLAYNSHALGGVGAALADMRDSAAQRAGLTLHANLVELAQVWWARIGGPGLEPGAYDEEYWYPMLRGNLLIFELMLLAFAMAPWHVGLLRSVRRGAGGGVLLLAAGLAWSLVMQNHAWVHRHLIMQVMPGLALLLGSLTAMGLAATQVRPGWAPARWFGPLLALLVILGFADKMRYSSAANYLYPFVPAVAANDGREEADNLKLQQVGAGPLRDLNRIYYCGGSYPTLAYEIGRPYELLAGVLPKAVAADEGVWIEKYSPNEQALAAAALEKFGLPERFGAGHPISLVFRATRAPATACAVPFANGWELREVLYGRALDGEGWLVQARFAARDEEAERAGLVNFVQLYETGEPPFCSSDLPLGKAERFGDELVTVHRFSNEEAKRARFFHIGLWDVGKNAAVAIEQEGLRKPVGDVAVGAAYVEIRLPVAGN